MKRLIKYKLHCILSMPKINIFKRKDNGEFKYSINLPKEVMESLAVMKGDELMFVSESGGELRFRLRRKFEVLENKRKQLEEGYKKKQNELL